jgi:hypothetical protein
MTVYPSLRSLPQRWEPIKPAPPVTKIFFILYLNK